MKKKQMLATLVMLSLLQGSVYADDYTINQSNNTLIFDDDTTITGKIGITGGNNHELDATITVNNGQGKLTFDHSSGYAINWTQGGNISINASETKFTGTTNSNYSYMFYKDSNLGTISFSGDVIFENISNSGAAIRGNDTSNVSLMEAEGDITFANVSTNEQIASLQALSLISKNIYAENVHQTGYDMMGSAFWVHRGTLQALGDNGKGGIISVKNSGFEHGAYGSGALWADNSGEILSKNIELNNISFSSASNKDASNKYASGIHAENGSHVIVGEKIEISDLDGSTINVAGIDLEGSGNVGGLTPPGGYEPEEDPATLLTAENISISNITALTNNLDAFGIRAIGDDEEADGLKIDSANLNIDEIKGSFAYGLAQIKEVHTNFDYAEISNIHADTEAAGVYVRGSQGNSEVQFGTLKVHDVDVQPDGLSYLVNVGNGKVMADNAELLTENTLKYHGSYDDDFSDTKLKIQETALKAIAGGQIDFNKESGIYTIVGNIVAGYGSALSENQNNIEGGKINISGNYVNIFGDVFAGNGGEVNITLNGEDSTLEGQIDDYHEITPENNKVFHNSSFFDDVGQVLDVTSAGKATLNINDGGKWIARGQSFVDTISLDGGIIDMSKNENSSVTVETLKGEGGRFIMRLDTGNHENSDMLYVTGTFEGNHELIIDSDEFVASEITENNPLRFATIKGDVNVENMKARVTDAGFFNNTYNITKESFDKNHEENEDYNGSGNGQGSYKPGNDVVTSTFDENDVNLLITAEGKQSQISDAGQTIINMSRANYSNAIYMDRLNKRMGEARYINPEDEQGMWVRLRHDRIGKEDAFRSQNTMYEMGYDVKQDCDNGDRRIGLAIDYMDGKTEYRNVAGDGDIKRYGLWLYDTWMGDKGHYADYVLKWGHLENDFEIYNSLGKVNGDYSNNVFSVSAEYGKKNDMGSGWYFEPQAQLQLARVTGADYVTSQNTKVSLDGINSLIGRAGFRLGRDLSERSTVYVKADLLHEFLGDQTISALDTTTNGTYRETFENKGTWYDVGFGFATAMGKNSYAFMDFEKSFGNDNDETYQINAGVQWTF